MSSGLYTYTENAVRKVLASILGLSFSHQSPSERCKDILLPWYGAVLPWDLGMFSCTSAVPLLFV